jgi:hypothetical protein
MTKSSHIVSLASHSVWLEPNPPQTSLLVNEMSLLAEKFGGHGLGIHRFLPHCTLLYKTSFPSGGSQIELKCEYDDMGKCDVRRGKTYYENA